MSPHSPGSPWPGENSDDETRLSEDPRLNKAIQLFNEAEWYACHDGLEELWHETQGPLRPLLQGILQIAVAHLHLERGNLRGATVLLGEGLGRLARSGDDALGLDLARLRCSVKERLVAMQRGQSLEALPLPTLVCRMQQEPPVD